MEIEEVFNVASAVLVSTGVAAAIIFGLSSWLGKIWASRILDKERQAYAVELEGLRSQLKTAAEKQQLVFAMYFEGQFKIYNDLWLSLVNLQTGIEQLWEEASSRNLKEFASALTRAEKKIRSSALLIDPEHYQEIMDAIKNMGDYQFGKERLISAKANLQGVQPLELAELIKKNGNCSPGTQSFQGGLQGFSLKRLNQCVHQIDPLLA